MKLETELRPGGEGSQLLLLPTGCCRALQEGSLNIPNFVKVGSLDNAVDFSCINKVLMGLLQTEFCLGDDVTVINS